MTRMAGATTATVPANAGSRSSASTIAVMPFCCASARYTVSPVLWERVSGRLTTAWAQNAASPRTSPAPGEIPSARIRPSRAVAPTKARSTARSSSRPTASGLPGTTGRATRPTRATASIHTCQIAMAAVPASRRQVTTSRGHGRNRRTHR
ncbi:hypothetical protein GCM10023191_060200 [Actinoallomurus oryzae]|uniref:Uncharacterized protein n=1 Tax=Actinoallomurus oryzae TaxID=502180 RepID=A0ABP8QL44_9ACTN